MCSAEAMCDIEADPESEIFVATVDVENCFYQMLMPEALSEYFALPAVLAKEVGVSSIGTTAVSRDEMIYPCFSVLPMGFSWSLYLAQNANESLAGDAGLLADATLIADRGAPLVLGPGKLGYYVYVDNVGVVGTSAEAVDKALDEVEESLRKAGLSTHERTWATSSAEALGMV